MIDPLGGVLTFFSLLFDDRERKRKANEYLAKNQKQPEPKPSWYQEPHRNSDGKIIIENSQLYYNDLEKYGAVQVQKWADQGKYNLTLEEMRKEEARIKAKYDRLYKL